MRPIIRPAKTRLVVVLFLAGLVLWHAPGGCRRSAPEADLSDRQFADLVVDVVHLHQRYAAHPDSLVLRKAALFRQRGATPEALERFIASRQAHPEAWAPVLQYLRKKLGEGTMNAHKGKALGRYRKGRADTLRDSAQ